MFKLSDAPLTLSGLFKNGWELYKASFRYVVLWSFILAIIHILPFLFNLVGFFEVARDGSYHFSWLALLIFLFLLVVEAFFITVFLYTQFQVATNQPVDLTNTFRLAKSLLLMVYVGLIVYFLAVNLGIILFILPAVYIAIIFGLYLPFLIFEKKSIYHAFDSSARLVWGNWWQTFFAIVLPYLALYMIRNITKFSTWGSEWIYLVDLIVLTIGAPYFFAMVIVQYNNLKIIKSLPETTSEENPRTQS